jgi:hypothetical protein
MQREEAVINKNADTVCSLSEQQPFFRKKPRVAFNGAFFNASARPYLKKFLFYFQIFTSIG